MPWASKGMGDADYMAAWELVLEPILTAFDPQLVLVSAGAWGFGDFKGRDL